MFQLNFTHSSSSCTNSLPPAISENWLDELKQIFISETKNLSALNVLTNHPNLLELYGLLTDKQSLVLPNLEKKEIIETLTQHLDLNQEAFLSLVEKILKQIKFPRNVEQLITQCVLSFSTHLSQNEQVQYRNLAAQKGLITLPAIVSLESSPEEIQKIQSIIEFDHQNHFLPLQMFSRMHRLLKNEFEHNLCAQGAPDDKAFQILGKLLMRLLENDADFDGNDLFFKVHNSSIIDIDWNMFFYFLLVFMQKKNILTCSDEMFGFLTMHFRDEEIADICESSIQQYFSANVHEYCSFLGFIEELEELEAHIKRFLKTLTAEQQITYSCAILNQGSHTKKLKVYLKILQTIDHELNLSKNLFETFIGPKIQFYKILTEQTIPHSEQLYHLLFKLSAEKLLLVLSNKHENDQSFLMYTCTHYPQCIEVLLKQCQQLPNEHLLYLFADSDAQQENLLQICLQLEEAQFSKILNFFSTYIPKAYQSTIFGWKNMFNQDLFTKACCVYPTHIINLLNAFKQLDVASQIAIIKQPLRMIISHRPALTDFLFHHLAQLPKLNVINLLTHPNILELGIKMPLAQFEELLRVVKSIDSHLVSKLLLNKDIIKLLITNNPSLNPAIVDEIKKLPQELQLDLFTCTHFTLPSPDDCHHFMHLLLTDATQTLAPTVSVTLINSVRSHAILSHLLDVYINHSSIHEKFQILLADILTRPHFAELTNAQFAGKFISSYSQTENIFRLHQIFNLTVQKSIKNNTLNRFMHHNLNLFLDSPKIINILIRNILHTNMSYFGQLNQYLFEKLADLTNILSSHPDGSTNLLHFAIEESINPSLFNALISSYNMSAYLIVGLVEPNLLDENVVQAAISRNSPLIATLSSTLQSFRLEEQILLLTGEKNYLRHAMHKMPHALNQIIDAFSGLDFEIHKTCWHDQALWKDAIKMADGRLDRLCACLQKNEVPKIISILEAQDEPDKQAIFEHLSKSLQQQLKQQTQATNQRLYSLFANADVEETQVSKKSCLSPKS